MNRNYLCIAEQNLIEQGAHYTAKEITNQPNLWQAIYQLAQHQQQHILSFLDNAFSNQHLDVILTGAGTSAFIGTSLAGIFKKYTGINARAIPMLNDQILRFRNIQRGRQTRGRRPRFLPLAELLVMDIFLVIPSLISLQPHRCSHKIRF